MIWGLLALVLLWAIAATCRVRQMKRELRQLRCDYEAKAVRLEIRAKKVRCASFMVKAQAMYEFVEQLDAVRAGVKLEEQET